MVLNNHLRSYGANTILSTLMLGLVAVSSFNFFAKTPHAAQENLSLRLLTPEIRPGHPLKIEASGDRRILCVVTLARRIKNLETGETVHKEFVPGGFYGIGPWREVLSVPTPRDLREGEYQFDLQQNNDCGTEVYPLSFPPRVFRVVNQN